MVSARVCDERPAQVIRRERQPWLEVWEAKLSILDARDRQTRLFCGETTRERRKFFSLLRLVVELVSDAPNGQDHLRIFGILLDFGAQAIDV
jgi:hypothetical protein